MSLTPRRGTGLYKALDVLGLTSCYLEQITRSYDTLRSVTGRRRVAPVGGTGVVRQSTAVQHQALIDVIGCKGNILSRAANSISMLHKALQVLEQLLCAGLSSKFGRLTICCGRHWFSDTDQTSRSKSDRAQVSEHKAVGVGFYTYNFVLQ